MREEEEQQQEQQQEEEEEEGGREEEEERREARGVPYGGGDVGEEGGPIPTEELREGGREGGREVLVFR